MQRFWPVFALTLVISISVSASPFAKCADILKYGIWENMSLDATASSSSAFANYYCSTKNHSDGIAGEALTPNGYDALQWKSSSHSSDCEKNSGSYSLSTATKTHLTRASEVIAKAWQQCTDKSNFGNYATVRYGAVPQDFQVVFGRNSEFSESNEKTATISFLPGGEITCIVNNQSTLVSSAQVNFVNEGVLVCRRTNQEEVAGKVHFSIGSSSASAGDEVAFFVQPIPSLPSGPSIQQRIARGDHFTITFSFPDSDGCGVQGTVLNDIMGQNGSYSMYYVPAEKKFVAKGPAQTRPNCGLSQTKYGGADIEQNQIVIGGRILQFDDDGHVWYSSRIDPQHIEKRFDSLMEIGKITF